MALANSLALKMANIDKKKSEIRGGEIVRDQNGQPTGILKGEAMLFVKLLTPVSNTKKYSEVAETATNYAATLGVTSVQNVHSDYIAEILREVQNRGKLKTRVYDCAPLSDWKKLADQGIKKATGDAMIRRGCLKGFTKGYPEEEEKIYEEALNADKAGLQVLIHAIGNRSNSSILNAFERIITENGVRDRRFRIEHAHGMIENDLDRLLDSNIIASVQPHLFGGRDPFKEIIKKNGSMAFGSDASMTDFNPILGIHDAVNSGFSFRGKNQSISVEEAVYAYTVGSAYAEFQEDVKGSISVGKLADLVMLSDDIFEIKPEEIRNTEVLLTIVDGKIVYNQRGN
jgi:predicted amidohydrolase YtcJ